MLQAKLYFFYIACKLSFFNEETEYKYRIYFLKLGLENRCLRVTDV